MSMVGTRCASSMRGRQLAADCEVTRSGRARFSEVSTVSEELDRY